MMNVKKIGFFILIINIVNNSNTLQMEENFDQEKILSMQLAFERGALDKRQLVCSHYSDANKLYKIEIEDLRNFFFREYIQFNRDLPLNKVNFLKVVPCFKSLPKSFAKVLYDAQRKMDVASFEETKAIMEKRLLEQKKEIWPDYWKYLKEGMMREREEAQLIRDYLEKNAKSKEEKEKMLQKMVEKINNNRAALKTALCENDPDQKKISELLQLLELRDLL